MRRTEYPCGEPERDNSSWCCSTRRSVKITHLILIFWTKNDNIRQVFGYVDMKELEDLGADGFTHSVVQQCRVPLVELRMRYHAAVNHRLVVSKHVRPENRYSEIPYCQAQIDVVLSNERLAHISL